MPANKISICNRFTISIAWYNWFLIVAKLNRVVQIFDYHGNTYKMYYKQNGDPLQSCQALRDDQVGYSNRSIDRTVEASNYLCGKILMGDQFSTWHLLFIPYTPVNLFKVSPSALLHPAAQCHELSVAWHLLDDLYLIVALDILK